MGLAAPLGDARRTNVMCRTPAAQRAQVLSRLLALNAERYEEELKAGLHVKGRKRVRSEGDEEDDGMLQ